MVDEDEDDEDRFRTRSRGTSSRALEPLEQLRPRRAKVGGGAVSPTPGVGGACENESSDEKEENDRVGVRAVA